MKLLGALLIDLGWIRPEHLDQALHVQETIGGRLGTCLLEVGALTEERLMNALAHQQRVPAATPTDLRNIPEEVCSVVPGRLAIRWRAIPFRMLGDDLHVAMLEVGNLAFHDEAAFATGKRIHVFLANEARLYDALSRYFDYRHPHGERFSRLSKLLDELETKAVGRRPLLTLADPAPEATARGVVDSRPERFWRQRFADLETPEELAASVVEHLATGFRRIGLFKVLRGRVLGWHGGGAGFDSERFAAFSSELTDESPFHDVESEPGPRVGPLPPGRVHNRLLECWETGAPFDCVVQPVRVGERPIAVLLCDAGSEGLRPTDARRVGAAADALGDALGRMLLAQRARRAVTLSGLIQTPAGRPQAELVRARPPQSKVS